MNYKEEPFLIFDEALQVRLDEIADQIHLQLLTPGQYVVFNEHQELGKKEFRKVWKHIPTNNIHRHAKKEYKGLYAFGEVVEGKLRVLYIGISRTIIRRFFKHTKTKQQNGATWAFAIAKHQNPNLAKADWQAMIPEIQNSLIKNCRFTFVTEDSNMLMHLAEAYCANKLKAYWNSFETH